MKIESPGTQKSGSFSGYDAACPKKEPFDFVSLNRPEKMANI